MLLVSLTHFLVIVPHLIRYCLKKSYPPSLLLPTSTVNRRHVKYYGYHYCPCMSQPSWIASLPYSNRAEWLQPREEGRASSAISYARANASRSRACRYISGLLLQPIRLLVGVWVHFSKHHGKNTTCSRPPRGLGSAEVARDCSMPESPNTSELWMRELGRREILKGVRCPNVQGEWDS